MKFCGNCAQPLAVACRRCGFENPPGFRFCGECAAPLGATDTEDASAPERTPRDYTPKHLADKILQSKSALEGERKQVTVLFADVKGSMDLQEDLDPEQWHRIMDHFFQILADGVHRFEGTVNQYTGDGIMALFGAPIAHEDHARRGCYAALRLRDEVRDYADELRVERGLNFGVRIGLNSGEVVVGKIGDDLRMDYTAQGHTVGLAQRMEQLAESGRICLSEHTARLAEGYFDLRHLGASRVKGVGEPLHVYGLEGVGPMQTRLDVSRSRGFSKFVGRGDELGQLEAALEKALAGNGQVLGIVADAGTGKSRLCFEFAELCRRRGLPVRSTSGVAHGRAIPLLPVLQFYRESFGIVDEDDDFGARQKIAGILAQLDRELLDALPILYDFLGVPDPHGAPLAYSGPELQRRLLALLKRITLARSEVQPAVILFEDLHWFDPGTETFLENLIDSVDGTRTLLLANYRPEYHADWLVRTYCQQIALAPLGPEAMAELLDDLLGSDPSLAGLAERIRTQTGGNPFFVEEIVQTLVESGALEGERGQRRLLRELASLEIPASVHAVLAARIDRLAESGKALLQTAAVIGSEFSATLLEHASQTLADAIADTLRPLVQAEFLHETALYPEPEYAFKHPLTQEVAYRSQLRERRAAVHRRVAEGLAELRADQPTTGSRRSRASRRRAGTPARRPGAATTPPSNRGRTGPGSASCSGRRRSPRRPSRWRCKRAPSSCGRGHAWGCRRRSSIRCSPRARYWLRAATRWASASPSSVSPPGAPAFRGASLSPNVSPAEPSRWPTRRASPPSRA
jgi:class 3 adenylate cyclase